MDVAYINRSMGTISTLPQVIHENSANFRKSRRASHTPLPTFLLLSLPVSSRKQKSRIPIYTLSATPDVKAPPPSASLACSNLRRNFPDERYLDLLLLRSGNSLGCGGGGGTAARPARGLSLLNFGGKLGALVGGIAETRLPFFVLQSAKP